MPGDGSSGPGWLQTETPGRREARGLVEQPAVVLEALQQRVDGSPRGWNRSVLAQGGAHLAPVGTSRIRLETLTTRVRSGSLDAMRQVSPGTRRWTRREYERLVETGFFRPGEPIELIGGELRVAEPQGEPHAVAAGVAADAL